MRAWAWAIVAAALVAAGFLAGTHWVSGRLSKAEAEHARQREQWAAERDKAQADARAEDARRVDAMQEVQRVAALSRAHDQADHRAAAAVGERVRAEARAAAARAAAADPSPADGGAPAAGPGLVLADLFGGADEAAGELAAALDAARTAGLACERSYDALTGPREPNGSVTP